MKYNILMQVGWDASPTVQGYGDVVLDIPGVIKPTSLGPLGSGVSFTRITDNYITGTNSHSLGSALFTQGTVSKIVWTDSNKIELLNIDASQPYITFTQSAGSATWQTSGARPVSRDLVTGEFINVEFTVTDTVTLSAGTGTDNIGVDLITDFMGSISVHRWMQNYAIEFLCTKPSTGNNLTMRLNENSKSKIAKDYPNFNLELLGTFNGINAISWTSDGAYTTWTWKNTIALLTGQDYILKLMPNPFIDQYKTPSFLEAPLFTKTSV